MNISELLNQRQSDRKYLSKPVDRGLIGQCIEAARISPSACNSQPWKFVCADESQLVSRLADAAAGMGMNKFVHQAPVIIAVVMEKMNATARIGSMLKAKDYSMIDIGIAVNSFVLQATELGLGTCILGWFDEKKVASLLNVPKGKRIPLLITLGYTDGEHRTKARKDTARISSWNSY